MDIHVDNEESQFRLRVSDCGIGIPNADQGRLFEAFHRGSNVGNVKGTGLGLAITKEAVELHGGTITVESKLGVGSNFDVRIPLTQPFIRVTPFSPSHRGQERAVYAKNSNH